MPQAPVNASATVRTDALLERHAKGPSPTATKPYFWTPRAHVYLSLFCFVVVLFLGLTEIMLNHPS